MAITNPYIKDLRRIWVGAKTLGIEEETLRLLLADITGKKSLKETTPTERAKLISELRSRGAYTYQKNRSVRRETHSAGPVDQKATRHSANDLISPEQRSYIHDLFIRLAAEAPDFGRTAYQQGFIKRVLGESRFYPQTRSEAQRIIEALKGRLKQGQKKEIIHEEHEEH